MISHRMLHCLPQTHQPIATAQTTAGTLQSLASTIIWSPNPIRSQASPSGFMPISQYQVHAKAASLLGTVWPNSTKSFKACSSRHNMDANTCCVCSIGESIPSPTVKAVAGEAGGPEPNIEPAQALLPAGKSSSWGLLLLLQLLLATSDQ